MERLKKAAAGKSLSAGGLNIDAILAYCQSVGITVRSGTSRSALNNILQAHLEKQPKKQPTEQPKKPTQSAQPKAQPKQSAQPKEQPTKPTQPKAQPKQSAQPKEQPMQPAQSKEPFEEIFYFVSRNISFGYEPFSNHIKPFNVDIEQFRAWTLQNGMYLNLLAFASKSGHVDSLMSLIDLYFPNDTIPDDVLYKIYILSIYWQHGKSNNPVRRYLATVFFDRLDITITPEIHNILTTIQIPRNLTGMNLVRLFNYRVGSDLVTHTKQVRPQKKQSGEHAEDIYNLEKAESSGYKFFKSTYGILARKYHPDKNPHGEEMFKHLTHIYSDVKLRHKW
jgi:hypothetical protein